MTFPVHIRFASRTGARSHAPRTKNFSTSVLEADAFTTRQGSASVVPVVSGDEADEVRRIDREGCIFRWTILDAANVPVVEDIAT